ncbi:class I SAM-dependent methyltransferase [Paenibacillus lutrae]|uniref:Methyltransferase domain-containing protein n=1 Tax=Paenibacillus lutrae TaxID=2078573 RepID=A0A7X3K003_9BACL|nr:class I SAM-dependent methyltransferase [Paenibacillus lutrae]MVP00577.1 methyltransferase domain-containing protein [Paenibacillus lutrae]
MSFSQYGPLCTEVYDHTKKIGQSLNGDLDYYHNKLKHCKGRILEAMAGSGRVLIPLLESGLQVDGMDYSRDMLASCRQRCEERGLAANLYESNLQELALPHKYEAILIPGGSFLLIEDRQQSIQALKRLYEHLEPGGRLLLDLFLPDPNFEAGRLEGISTFHLPDGDTITLENRLVEADLFSQSKVNHLKYEKWRNGTLIQTELQRFALRWYGVEEFKLLLESVGFTDVNVSADFEHGKQPSSSKQTFVYEAVKN